MEAAAPRTHNPSHPRLPMVSWLTRSPLAPVLLLTVSNVFMTFAWYGHLRHKGSPLLTVILVSWGIAFFEYCFQVPTGGGTRTFQRRSSRPCRR